MMKLLSAVAAISLATLSYADQFTVTNGATVIAVPGVVASSAMGSVSNWVASTNYVAGAIAKAFGQPYVCRYAGTSGATNGVFTGKTTVTDGGVTWIKTTVGERSAVVIQRVSGGALDLNFANGAVRLTADGASVALSETAVYQGNITATASGSNVVVNTLWY
jgi:hypothetical protein